MKIAYYSYDHVSNPWCGGGGAYRDLTINRILAQRSEVRCYYGNYKGAKAASEHGLRCFFLGAPLNYAISRITFSLLATVHCLFTKADIIVICYSVFAPVLGFIPRRSKTVVEIFHLVNKEPFRKYGIFGVFPFIFEKTGLVFSKNIVCINQGLAGRIKSAYKRKTIATIYTGFNEQLLSVGARDDRYVLFFGRIDIHMKGIDVLLDAFEKIAPFFSDMRLVLAGRGSLSDTEWLKTRIGASALKDRISFKENVSDHEKTDLFHGATFVCMPSRFEGWCISAIEAAASSKASIGTRIMGLSESIIDKETGILVSPENAVELAETMALLLRDASLRKRLGDNGHRWALRFRWEEIANAQESLYRSVIKRNH